MQPKNYDAWPALPYAEFSETAHVLHMLVQAIGKTKLITPFEPHWANVALWLTYRGFTTGPISYQQGIFSIELDLIEHKVICQTSWSTVKYFDIKSGSVAELTHNLFATLHELGINKKINLMPQEIPNPIAFDQDTTVRQYNAALANAWMRIMTSTYIVLQRYHARFRGITPPVGLMWGTFDLRDARYLNVAVPTEGINSDYIRRNAMDVAQVEVGFWHGNPQYQKPAYFSFTYPQPKDIEKSIIQPKAARWDKTLGEFIFDYDDVRTSTRPAEDLQAFFESTYAAGSTQAHWDPTLLGKGIPV